MRRSWFVVLLASSVLGTTGCASLFRAPATIDRMDVEIQAIRAEQAALRQDIEKILAAQETQSGLQRENNADLQTRLAEITETLATLQAQLEEVTRRSASRVREERPPLPPASADTSGTGAVPSQPTEMPDPNRLYESAYLDVTRGNYPLAIQGFGSYLQYYPNTELSDNAQYWIGEAYYAQNDFASAIREYQKLIDSYPKGDKVPAALLKLGFSNQTMGEEAAARAALERITKDFPKSEEARLAKDRLASLGPGKR
jgi:tol-pal system protein YbgF